MIVGYVEVGDDAENSLMLFELDLFSGQFLSGITHGYLGHCRGDTEFGPGQNEVMAGLKGDVRRSPAGKSRGADGDVIRVRIEIVEFKESSIVRHDRARSFQVRAFKNDIRPRDRVVIQIDDSADNDTPLCHGGVRQRSRLLLSLGSH